MSEYRSRLNTEDMTCKVVKKRKPRGWTASAVGRVYCEAILSGVDPSEIRDELKKCAADSECDCEDLKKTIEQQRDILQVVEAFVGLLVGLKLTIAVAKRARLAREEKEAIELSEAAAKDVEKLKKLIRLSDEQLAVIQERAFKNPEVIIKP